jgi:transposase-like protein
MSTAATPQTLQEAIRYFSDPDVCLDFMVSIRWPLGIVCPTCGSKEVTFLATRRVWKCKTKHPKQQFSAKVGTVFEDSPIGLDKWFAAAWMVANCKNGVSSYEIHRALGVTQKTAWFMDHRIRLAMQAGSFGKKLSGTIEADETFIGGAARFMHKDKRARKIKGAGSAGKEIVMGMLDRRGEVRVMHVRANDSATMHPLIRENVEAGSELFTDANLAYSGMQDYARQVVDHAETYVIGRVHTNGIENFWSLLKRGLKGTYVSVQPFHLFRYLDEQTFRYNKRKTNDGGRFVDVMRGVTGKRLTYEKLTGDDLPEVPN